MIPLVGIGTLPSVIIVVFYAVLPILRNAVVGLQAVSPDLVEAARGQGMSSVAVFFRVRLPLAWPVIITGIRVSAHMSMGVAAIAAYALGPGLGSYIYTGLSQIGNANALNYALASSAVSICGVSAAIAAAGAVKAKKEHLAYTATMVIAFELPSISILPWLADLLGLSPAVAGVWIGGNIDTTAAVSAAGAPAGEDSLQIASIVKVTQNALIGVVAVALTAWFALRVERDESAPRIRAIDFWHRFPKFVLGFIAASVAVTVAAEFRPFGVQRFGESFTGGTVTVGGVEVGEGFGNGSGECSPPAEAVGVGAVRGGDGAAVGQGGVDVRGEGQPRVYIVGGGTADFRPLPGAGYGGVLGVPLGGYAVGEVSGGVLGIGMTRRGAHRSGDDVLGGAVGVVSGGVQGDPVERGFTHKGGQVSR